MFKIRDVVIDPPIVLAPVAGHTDSLFRQAIKGLGGCGLVVSELVSTEGMTRHPAASSHLTHFQEIERPISIQIFGSDSARMADSAAMVEAMGADIVDVNVGCPVKKVVKQGGGSNLLRDLPLLGRILRAVRMAIKAPLSVKIRSGWDRNSINAVEVLKLAEDCGVEGLAIHGRTRCDLFSGQSDWKIVAQVKEQAKIPIIGNGDVFAPADAERMFRETGVDGIMIGRGVLSNPWLIRQCWDYLSGKAVKQVSLIERAEFMMNFLEKVQSQSPPHIVLGKLKKIGGYLSKGFPGSTHLRARMHASRATSEFFEVVREYLAHDAQQSAD
ncbi:MAG: tRNA dihydrouridine synthase DusB [Acidobacteria bacterium]|nr:tRNA dihydrouridine synthase DusB [Acidobacteriota bacterium]